MSGARRPRLDEALRSRLRPGSGHLVGVGLGPAPARFCLWGLGLLVDFATPLGAGKLHSQLAPHPTHLPERFALFIIIVLGEAIAGVVMGLTKHPWSVQSDLPRRWG